jgi:hypothetical protein
MKRMLQEMLHAVGRDILYPILVCLEKKWKVYLCSFGFLLFHGCLLGSRVSMWWMPRMAFGAAATLLYIIWCLSHPTWGG